MTLVKATYRVIVIGNGPVGVHFVNQLIRNGIEGNIAVFGDEEYRPYNRVKLSSYLNGDLGFSDLDNPIVSTSAVETFWHCRIASIDPQHKRVIDQFGNCFEYESLVIAAGSSPHVPNTPGQELPGVYCFRNMKDTEALFARRIKSRSTVVVGGGLLGIETAKAMLRHATEVTLIHHSNRLMNRQLDDVAALRLKEYAEHTGIHIKLNTSIKHIQGDLNVEAVKLSTQETLHCDTVIFATGIRPNSQLALAAKLRVQKGIAVDQNLQTSEQDVYAIGECADYNGEVFGLVAPGLEQASILAANLCGESKVYRGASLITELKVMGLPVFSMGQVGDEYENQIDDNLIFEDAEHYRRLFLSRGKLVGAVFVGDTAGIKQYQNAIQQQKHLLPWHKRQFTRTGQLFSDKAASVNALPNKTIICNCQQVSAGQIRACQKQGAATFEQVQASLNVSTNCGTCKPLVQSLLHEEVETQPIKRNLLILTCLAAILAISWWLLPSPETPDSVQTTDWTWLWTDGLARQISGFTILGLTVIGLLFSMRKRLKNVRWLSFDFWRGWHVALTSIALLTLFAHTGISIGEGINRWLILNFLLIIAVGIASGIVASLEGRLVSTRVKAVKRSLVWGHIISFWPFPVLLAYHILSVYYF